MQSERRKRRFLKKTSGFFYPTEELLLAVPYSNAAGAASYGPVPPRGIIGTLTKMAELATGNEERSAAEQQTMDAMGAARGETGFPQVAGWVAFTRDRLLVFPTSIRMEMPSELAVAHPMKNVAGIEVHDLMHGNVSANISFVDGSSQRIEIRDNGHLVKPLFEQITGRST